MKMMHRETGSRYGSMKAVVAALTKYLKGEKKPAPRPRPRPEPEPAPVADEWDYQEEEARPTRRRRKKKKGIRIGGKKVPPAALGGGIAVVLAGLLWVVFGGGSESAVPEPPPGDSIAAEGTGNDNTPIVGAAVNPGSENTVSVAVNPDVQPSEPVIPNPGVTASSGTQPDIKPAEPLKPGDRSDLVCERMSTFAAPVALQPGAVPFASTSRDQNGVQFTIPEWKAWSSNEFQFDLRLGTPQQRGFYLIQPFRFGHFVLLFKPDNCGVYAFREWPGRSPSPYPSVKLPAFGNVVFPLQSDRDYRISSYIDQVGNYLLSVDGQEVLSAKFEAIREYIVDARVQTGLPRGPVRPMVFRTASHFEGEGLVKKWPAGTAGLVIDVGGGQGNIASDIRIVQRIPAAAHPVSEEQLESGLVAWYQLDESSGREVTDSSGNGHSAAAGGDLLRVRGVSGGAVQLDGDTEIVIGDIAGFEWNEKFTLCAWVSPDAMAGSILRKRNEVNRGYTLMFGRGSLGWGAVHTGANMLGIYAGEGAMWPKCWSHVAVAYDGTGRKLAPVMYIDGRQVKYMNVSGTLSATMRVPDPLVIGRAFTGKLDDVRVYNRMLSNEEITFLAAPDRP